MAVDPLQQLGLVTREVQDQERQGGPARVVVASREYDTQIEDLWEAITSPERIPRWFLPITGELRLGGRYQLEGNAGGEIQACVPPRQLAVSWEFGGGVSWLEVTLSPVAAQRTRLELRHIVPIDDHWKQFGPGAVGVGWELALYGLALYYGGGGAAVDRAAALAWMGSEEGKTFLRRSSGAWCLAAIAGGDDPAAARAQAARTTAAYTGEPAPADAG
jgi:uncharacterized protein YndB with AHSA1/START domain